MIVNYLHKSYFGKEEDTFFRRIPPSLSEKSTTTPVVLASTVSYNSEALKCPNTTNNSAIEQPTLQPPLPALIQHSSTPTIRNEREAVLQTKPQKREQEEVNVNKVVKK